MSVSQAYSLHRLLAAAFFLAALTSAHAQLGDFARDGDIGTVLHPGSAHFDAMKGVYTVSGSGENMWFGMDDFHFVWTRMSGDVALEADIAFVGTTGNNHRKAALLIRQTLESGSKYVDVARHGDGLTSLQYRDETGADTHELESSVSAPQRVRIEKRGNYAYVFISDANGQLKPSGAAMRVDFTGEFYIGLGVCSHDKDVTETALFSNVKLQALHPATGKPVLYSTLETVTVASTDRRVAYVAPEHLEAPNWTRDGTALLFNKDGTMRRLVLGSSSPVSVQTGPEVHCNNDHGLSKDGSLLAISDQSSPDGKSRIYTLSSAGGTPRQITPDGPSYWHGWSPDGKTIAFTGERSGEFDIYIVPAAGGKELRLTSAKGLDDGPEYSPDGAYIYFNSERTGSMQIWRMKTDGSNQEQVLNDASNDWFPHISPDGKWMVFLAYDKSVSGHPPNQDVELRLMSMTDKKVHVLAKLFGGQGTINVPSWSPDSTKLAFVSYELLPE
jgi:TolB protein